MKILKTKTYNFMNMRLEKLTKQVLLQQGELNHYKNVNLELGANIGDLEVKLENKTKEIVKLKQLLTKSNIDYKHLYKKEGK